jgi:hypothetical protein
LRIKDDIDLFPGQPFSNEEVDEPCDTDFAAGALDHPDNAATGLAHLAHKTRTFSAVDAAHRDFRPIGADS